LVLVLIEARTLARFQHSSIVRVSQIFEAHSTAYMVMDFERGENLESWLKRLEGRPSQADLDCIAAPLLDALEMIHAEKFLHRDIAPDNIIIRPDGTPVLLDFGAARRAVAERSRALTGIVKAGYSPHEQYATDSRMQGPWSDIYALGGTLYRAIAGNAPEEATLRIADDPMIPASKLGRDGYRPGFLSAVDACLRVKHTQRPQSIAQLRPMLLGMQTSGVQLETSSKSSTLDLPKRPWSAIAAGAVVLVGLAHGLLDYAGRNEERIAKEQHAAAVAKARSEQERLDRQEAETRRKQQEQAAAKEQTAVPVRPIRALDPGAPFAEYFKDLPIPSAPALQSVLPPVGTPAPLASGRGWIGIKVQSVNDDIAERFGAQEHRGAIVSAVTAGSPAAQAGIREGDIILRFDGKNIAAMRDLPPIIRAAAIGTTVPVDVWRDDHLLTLQAKIARSQGDAPDRRRSRRGRQ
jgi:protein kinase-like protein/PDZ domain-containing protein